MRRLRASAATLALLGLMFPWARLVATSLHLAEGHHDLAVTEPAATEHAAATLEEAFHGHHHDDDATPHDHPLVTCDLSAQRSRTLENVALPAGLTALFALILPPRVPALVPWRSAGTREHGPPRALSGVILRI